jgi:sec-independent protein translocase protein TatA
MRLGWGELLVIFAIIVLIVGARRLPEIGRALGQSIREFQEAIRGKHKQDGHAKESE